MDRFNATKLGEPLPSLEREISEDPEKGANIEWSTDYVYTMALWRVVREQETALWLRLLFCHLTFATTTVKPMPIGAIGRY
jgi:hypothetical protein